MSKQYEVQEVSGQFYVGRYIGGEFTLPRYSRAVYASRKAAQKQADKLNAR